MKYIYTLIALALPMFAHAEAAEAAEEILYQNDLLATVGGLILTGLSMGAAYLGRLIQKKLKAWGMNEEAIDALSTQVTLLWHEEVKDLKKTLRNNKITKEDALRLRRTARERAVQALTGPAKDFLISKGKDWASAKIEDIISAKKGK